MLQRCVLVLKALDFMPWVEIRWLTTSCDSQVNVLAMRCELFCLSMKLTNNAAQRAAGEVLERVGLDLPKGKRAFLLCH